MQDRKIQGLMVEGMHRVMPDARIVLETKVQDTWDKVEAPAVDVVADNDPDRADAGLDDPMADGTNAPL